MGLIITPSGFLLANGSIPLTANWNMGAFTSESKQTAATANTVYDGFLLTNSTTASSGNQMYSPTIHWSGKGWATGSGGSSQSVDFRSYVIPVQGTTNPTGGLAIESSVNGAAYTNQIIFNSAGQMVLPIPTGAAPPFVFSNSLTSGWYSRSATYMCYYSASTVYFELVPGTGMQLNSTLPIGWSSSAPNQNAPDVGISRAAAGILSLTYPGASLGKIRQLVLDAGTAAAARAPLKFTSGTNLTTAEAGAMEYNGTNLFFTRSGTTREGVITQSAVTTEVVVSDTSVTINIGGTTYKLLAKA